MNDQLPDFSRGGGLLPAIAQDHETGRVLMLAWMNAESFEATKRTRRAVYFSRSRNRLWAKGEQSGHVQHVVEIRIDCDGDAILLLVTQQGAACHEGFRSCFFRQWSDADESWNLCDQRLVEPDDVYRGKQS